jgi:hypothetical protein
MSEPISEPDDGGSGSHSDLQSALFLEMAGQIANLALIFLGRVPHPETGKPVKDLESARTFIDQLDMLEVKTKGNLNKREESFLKQSLMATRMAFVEVMEEQAGTAQQPTGTSTSSSQGPAPAGEEAPEDPNAETEARKKFIKKY